MSTQTKEFVAVAHSVIGLSESALKQLTAIFNRIGIQGLSIDPSTTPFISPDFLKLREWLAELGILFDVDMEKLRGATAHGHGKTLAIIIEDTDLIIKPSFGMSALEMVAAREEKANQPPPAAEFGLSGLMLELIKWYPRQGSNLRPFAPEANALIH